MPWPKLEWPVNRRSRYFIVATRSFSFLSKGWDSNQNCLGAFSALAKVLSQKSRAQNAVAQLVGSAAIWYQCQNFLTLPLTFRPWSPA